MTRVCPSITSRRILSNTVCLPNRLVTSRTCMAALGIFCVFGQIHREDAETLRRRESRFGVRESLDSLFENWNVKIDEKTELVSRDFDIANGLRTVDPTQHL